MGLDCTPLYFPAFLERFPHRLTDAVRQLADAPAGGVLVHCSAGRDRTGLVVLVLLAVVGVTHEAIVADYQESTTRLDPLWPKLGLGDQTATIEAIVRARGTTIGESLTRTLQTLDAEALLRENGMTSAQLRAVRTRLIGDHPGSEPA